LINILVCPSCKTGKYQQTSEEQLTCQNCGQVIFIKAGIPCFTAIPEDIRPTEKRTRGASVDTPWRQANTKFLKEQSAALPSDAVILDIGAGPGEFAAIFSGRQYFSIDIYPYAEVDLVCDITQVLPFAPASVDVVVLTNVLEHLPEAANFLKVVSGLLHPGGKVLVSVPFMLKIHQAPYDFARYTHYLLERMGRDAGLSLDLLDGYYDPTFLAGESMRYIRFWTLPKLSRVMRLFVRTIMFGMDALIGLLGVLIGRGFTRSVTQENNPAPVGYHVIYRKI